MIFSRVIKHAQVQNWTAVVIELAVVVLGVFLGLQASNWNQERISNQQSAQFTARLKADLRGEAWAYEYLIDYNREINKHQRQVLDAVAGDIALSDEQFLISAYRATQYKYNDRFRATYDELVSTGNMGLVADQALRETAVSVFTTPLLDTITQEANHSEYRRLFRETVTAELQEALLARCGDHFAAVGDYAAIPGSIDYPCTLAVAPAKVTAAVAALKASPRFVPALQLRFADTQTALTDLQVSNEVVRRRLHAIREAKP